VNARLKSILIPAGHTFWQAFLALVGVWWTAAGAGLFSSVTDVADGKRVAIAAGTAVLAAALSALKSTIRTLVAERTLSVATMPDVPDGPDPADMVSEPAGAPAEHTPEHAEPTAPAEA
jgi:hypothetical protein